MGIRKTSRPRISWQLGLAGIVLLGGGMPAWGQVSLATVVDLAQKNSSAVKLADADLQKAEAALAQTHDAYIPNLTVGSNAGYSHGYPTGQPSVGNATMQSLVFSYSASANTSKAARAGVEAANLSLKDAREQVALGCIERVHRVDSVSSRAPRAAHQEETFIERT